MTQPYDIQLNAFQYGLITHLIQQGQVIFAALEPMESDTVDQTLDYNAKLEDIRQLESFKLVQDYSDTPKFKPLIDNARETNQRTYKIYGLTELALMCFTNVNGQGAVN
jgi:hypothetical protein